PVYRDCDSMKASRAQLIPLRCRADYRMLGFIAILCLLYVVQWTGIFRHWILLAATSILCFVAFVARHNHIHCRTFWNPNWNAAFEYLLVLCTGQPAAGIVAIHNE